MIYLLHDKCLYIWRCSHGKVLSGCESHTTGYCSAPHSSPASETSRPLALRSDHLEDHTDTTRPSRNDPENAKKMNLSPTERSTVKRQPQVVSSHLWGKYLSEVSDLLEESLLEYSGVHLQRGNWLNGRVWRKNNHITNQKRGRKKIWCTFIMQSSLHPKCESVWKPSWSHYWWLTVDHIKSSYLM